MLSLQWNVNATAGLLGNDQVPAPITLECYGDDTISCALLCCYKVIVMKPSLVMEVTASVILYCSTGAFGQTEAGSSNYCGINATHGNVQYQSLTSMVYCKDSSWNGGHSDCSSPFHPHPAALPLFLCWLLLLRLSASDSVKTRRRIWKGGWTVF